MIILIVEKRASDMAEQIAINYHAEFEE